jgi:hypothetical protein
MRKLTYPLIGLALAATAANAQETPDQGSVAGPEAGAAAPADAVPPATPDDAVPPADDSVPPESAAPEHPAPAAQAPDASPEASPEASVAQSSDFTDEQVDQFAEATVKLQAINKDASIAAEEKQSRMATAVTEAGLDPATYNKIGHADAVDPELRNRVQGAMARHSGGGETAGPTAG